MREEPLTQLFATAFAAQIAAAAAAAASSLHALHLLLRNQHTRGKTIVLITDPLLFSDIAIAIGRSSLHDTHSFTRLAFQLFPWFV